MLNRTNKLILIIFLLFTFIGCMSLHRKAPTEQVQAIKKIAIVAFESPPIGLPSTYTIAAGSVYREALRWYGPGSIIIAGIVFAVNLPKAEKKFSKMSMNYDAWRSHNEEWKPSLVLGKAVANQIASNGKYQVIMHEEICKLPGLINREETFLMENWMAPYRDWYNSSVSAVDLREFREQDVDAIVEVGLSNIDLYVGKNLIMVMRIKLIDARNGTVSAKSYDYGVPSIEPLETIFENRAERFKDIFNKEGKILAERNLKAIGLIP